MTFHACRLLSKDANPTKKPLYLVCVTVVDPQKKASWQASRTSSHDDDEDEEDPEVEYEEEAKLKFFDFQNALRSDILNPDDDEDDMGPLQVKSLSKSLTTRMQITAQKVWLDDEQSDKKNKGQRSAGKLGMIEEHLDDIVTDVKKNLTSLFNRGE